MQPHTQTAEDALLSFDPLWFDAPPERTPEFFPTYLRISKALQTTLRRLLPERYLADLERFRDTRRVYPLLVYASSGPFFGRARTDLTYDILNKKHMATFQYWVRLNLPKVLEPIHARLRAAGMEEVAKLYRPGTAGAIAETVDRLKICRRRLQGLLKTDTLLLNELIAFAGSGRFPARTRTQIEARCRKAWLSKLRRIWAKQDYTELAPELLAACTKALRQALTPSAEATDLRAASNIVTSTPHEPEPQISSLQHLPAGRAFAVQTPCQTPSFSTQPLEGPVLQ